MPNYRPYITDDGSIGLFSGDYDDIFHSRYGALTEAYEKFVFPANIDYYLNKNNSLKVLDICYGIGYNSKALLKVFLEKMFEKKFSLSGNSIVSICTDNLTQDECDINIGSIGDDKTLQEKLKTCFRLEKLLAKNNQAKFISSVKNAEQAAGNKTILSEVNNEGCCTDLPRLQIDALEFEKEFVYLSPFIKRICYNDALALPPAVDYIILHSLYKQYGAEFINAIKKSNVVEYSYKFFDKLVFKNGVKMQNKGYKYTLRLLKNALLHNIYYQNISKRPASANGFFHDWLYRYVSKRGLRDFTDSLVKNIDINFYTDDARQEIKNIKNQNYDIIFLDAFTPAKLPTLWTVEFFQKLYELISPEGVLLTYSNSARIRSALLEVGFYIGNLETADKHLVGTIASKDSAMILQPLSDKEIGLLETKAGIPYRDKDLSATPEEILNILHCELNSSNRISSSQYLKGVKNEI